MVHFVKRKRVTLQILSKCSIDVFSIVTFSYIFLFSMKMNSQKGELKCQNTIRHYKINNWSNISYRNEATNKKKIDKETSLSEGSGSVPESLCRKEFLHLLLNAFKFSLNSSKHLNLTSLFFYDT